MAHHPSAPARSRKGKVPFKMTTAKLRLAQAAMGKLEMSIVNVLVEV
jgi:hypothetical protein